MIKFIYIILAIALCSISDMMNAQAPVFQGVRVQTSVQLTGTTYKYGYTVYNPTGNTAEFSTMSVRIDNPDHTSVPVSSPALWLGLMSADGLAINWGEIKETPPILPGTSLSGFSFDAYAPPAIGKMEIAPFLGPYIRQIISERDAAQQPFPMSEQKAIRASYLNASFVLVPRRSQGTYDDFDRWMMDTVQAKTLGWISDITLLGQIKVLQGQARDAAKAQDGFTAIARLTSIIDLIQASTPAQRTDEGYALIYYNALYLTYAGLYPCEPIFKLEPESATHHLGEAYTATATLTNRVDGLPIEANRLQIRVSNGPHLGQQVDSFTDAGGQLSFTYTGIALGVDTVQAIAPPGEIAGGGAKTAAAGVRRAKPSSRRTTVRAYASGKSASSNCVIYNYYSSPVKVLWQDGPDLLVNPFIPPVLKSGPGKTFYITEVTENRGKITAAESVTRYYLSLNETIDPATDRVIGQRTVPALAPGANSEVREIPFTVPLDLPAGKYHLTACADADQQVIETDESNNCAQDLLENRMGGMVEISDNHPPVAQDQTLTVIENSNVSLNLTASDAENDPLTYTVIAPPEHGTLSGVAPSLTYTPAAHHFGLDIFRFVANDGKADSNIGTVSITTVQANHPPVASSQAVLIQMGITKAISLGASDPDLDPLIYVIVAPPTHGTLSGAAPNIAYTPATGYHGSDLFTFKANDGKADSNVATVSIRVNAVPDCAKGSPSPPYLTWPPNHKLRPVAIIGVTDPDGDPVTLTATSIRQDEPVKSPGSGNFSPDATLSPLQLRAEREGGGDGRIYHMNFTASDNQGGVCTGAVTVCVPHDQGQPPNCGDGGPVNDSTLP